MLTPYLIAVGTIKERYLTDACGEYLKRLGAFCKPVVAEIAEQRLPDSPSRAQIADALAGEAQRIRAAIPPRAFTVALCVGGERMSSQRFAGTLQSAAQHYPAAAFLIGSSHGLDTRLEAEARLRLSLSDMTFPHQLARVLLLEQLYRAAMIEAGRKYHK